MVDIEIINPGTPVAGPYNPGIKAGNLLFISGQGPMQSIADIKDQTHSTLEKIKKNYRSRWRKCFEHCKNYCFFKKY